MKFLKLIGLSFVAIGLYAQSSPATAPCVSTATRSCVKISVNWPPHQLVEQKYGPIPKQFTFGEVVGCNQGDNSVVFGEGEVIAALRESDNVGGLQAFSRQDALSLVGNSQSNSKKNRVTGWVRAGADSAVEAKATGLIQGPSRVGLYIVLGAELSKIIMPNVQGVLNLRQMITYNADGLQGLMQITGGRCSSPASVLFAIPASVPKQPVPAEPVIFTMPVAVTK